MTVSAKTKRRATAVVCLYLVGRRCEYLYGPAQTQITIGLVATAVQAAKRYNIVIQKEKVVVPRGGI